MGPVKKLSFAKTVIFKLLLDSYRKTVILRGLTVPENECESFAEQSNTPLLKAQMCGINAVGVQGCGCMSAFCHATLKIAVLLHKTANDSHSFSGTLYHCTKSYTVLIVLLHNSFTKIISINKGFQ